MEIFTFMAKKLKLFSLNHTKIFYQINQMFFLKQISIYGRMKDFFTPLCKIGDRDLYNDV